MTSRRRRENESFLQALETTTTTTETIRLNSQYKDIK